MDLVKAQYEAFPYPERNPKDEKKRLIVGSPSDPIEVDHFVFGGCRDWAKPFRALFAGGGTGDGLIQMAQKLSDAQCPAEITWLDPSLAAREIAEARAHVRGLDIEFVTGDLGAAPELGPFDYIDCCGVLHHLEDPQSGFNALSRALGPDGGLGLMVYAPFGRTGVYALQQAFGMLLSDVAPEDRIAPARSLLGKLPETNWFARNDFVGDHNDSDAGLYDLLLHSRDRPYSVPELIESLERADLEFVSFLEAGIYDPSTYLPENEHFTERVKRLDPKEKMTLAELLAGHIKTHIAYAVPKARGASVMAKPNKPDMVPRLHDLPAQQLAKSVASKGELTVTVGGAKRRIAIPGKSSRLIAMIDGRSLGDMAQEMGLDWFAFGQAWAPVHRALTSYNLLRYSKGLS